MSGDNVSSADNQQGTLYYYFTGFIVGESSVSIIKATNKGTGQGFYFALDLTVSNADLILLKELNQVVACEKGIISPIKGGYNLSIRGKEKIKPALSFLNRFPPPAGDLFKEKLNILKKALELLSVKNYKIEEVEKLRQRLKDIKITAKAVKHFPVIFDVRSVGYFLSGIVDAEGSMGWRRSGNRQQPYFCVLMREEAIIDLFIKQFGFGHKYYRPKEKLYHFETGKREDVAKLADYFLNKFPVKLAKNRQRLENLQRILNDYMPSPAFGGEDIV